MLSENYKKYFKMMMDKHGIKSLDQLSSEEKKREIDRIKNYTLYVINYYREED